LILGIIEDLKYFCPKYPNTVYKPIRHRIEKEPEQITRELPPSLTNAKKIKKVSLLVKSQIESSIDTGLQVFVFGGCHFLINGLK